jgi:hypothetical protein
VKKIPNIDPNRGGWIGYTDWVLDSRPVFFHPIAFRRDFNLAAAPRNASLIITAADKYGLWLNGKLVDYGPARSNPQNKSYDTFDISPYLRKGANQLAVLVSPCTGANFVGVFTRMGLFLQANVRLISGKKVTLDSDESWLCRIAEWITN